QVGDTIYAFVGLERVGGVMVYDITDPANATFDQYIPAQVGDGPVNAGPEGLEFIPAEDSPTGQALLVVSAEDSSTLAVYTIEDGRNFQLVSAVQGSTAAGDGDRTVGVDDVSPLEGQEVTVTAIVTADFTGDGSLGGFTIQEEDADSDGDDTTSEGIFIQAPDAMVELGDLVQVTGIVQEVDGETRIIADVVTTISSGNDLPTATVVEFPTADVLIDQDGDFVADLEAYEGMLVTIPEDLFVTELFQLDRFGTIRVSSEGRLEQFTENNAPDADGFEQHLRDVASRSLVLDDGLSTQNPDPIFIPDGDDNVLSAGEDFRMGDTLANVTGVITYSEDPTGSEEPEFRIHTPEADYTNANPRPTEAEDVGGNLKVATFNVLNFFTTLDTFPGTEGVGADGTLDPRGADTNPQNAVDGVGETDEFDRQLEKLVNAIEEIDSDIIGLSELENDFLDPGIRPVDTDAQGDRTFAIAELVEALNASAGAEVWGFADPGVENVGTDAISTGIIYRTDAVTQVGTTEFLVFTEASSAATQVVADVLNPFVDGDDQLTNLQRNRPAVAATFEDENGERVTVAVNHYKSKGDSGLEDLAEAAQEALDGGAGGFTQADIDALLADPNYDQNDGAAFWNAVRTDASNELVAWLDTDPTGGGTDNILVVGDLNSYKEEDPVTALEDAGYGNLAEIFEADDTGSFVFDGQLGTLDYIFANEDVLGDVTGATIYDINSPEPDVFDFNLEFGRDPALFTDDTSFRSSDHDPVIAGLDLTGAGIVADFVGTSANDDVTGTEGNDTFSQFGAQGMDRITTLDGMDQIIFGPEINAPGRGMVTVVDFDAVNDIIVQSGVDIGVTQGRGDVLLFSDSGIFARLVDTDRADVQIIDDLMI
ncbi:MAG: ExeM/NucH family extracellular endonuclease, partial [Pseudomonadota bacterium]